MRNYNLCESGSFMTQFSAESLQAARGIAQGIADLLQRPLTLHPHGELSLGRGAATIAIAPAVPDEVA